MCTKVTLSHKGISLAVQYIQQLNIKNKCYIIDNVTDKLLNKLYYICPYEYTHNRIHKYYNINIYYYAQTLGVRTIP